MDSKAFDKCISCLGNAGPSINLYKCVHKDLIEKFLDIDSMTIHNIYLCKYCHAILEKLRIFQLNVEENCKLLTKSCQYQKKYKSIALSVSDVFSVDLPALTDDASLDLDLDYDALKSEDEDVKPLNIEEIYITNQKQEDELKSKKSKPKLATLKNTNTTTRATLKIKKKDSIIKITLSRDEVLEERERERNSEAFQKFLYKCERCIVGYDFEQTLKQHLLRHTKKQGDMVCDICECVFNKEQSFFIHVRRHYTRYECTECKYRCRCKNSMQVHYQSLHDANSTSIFNCDICGQECNSKRALRYHKEKHIPKKQCNYCKKYFSSKSSIKKHILKTHSETRTYNCSLCSKVYKGSSGLLAHTLSHHKSDSTVSCSTCNVTFKNIYNYQHHLKTHSRHTTEEDRRFACDLCDMKFLYEYKLQDHKDWVHYKNYRHVCAICDKKYISLRGLEKHKKGVHEKRKPPKNKICDYCGQAFITNSALESHIRTHTGERPISCPYCSSTFKQTAALYRHKKQVHNYTSQIEKQ